MTSEAPVPTAAAPVTAPVSATSLGPHTAVLLVAGFASIVLAAVTMLLHVPYAELQPGPAINTLGSQSGKPLISVSGHPTYPTSGSLELTTVTVSGGPGANLSVFEVLRGWLDPSAEVVPEDAVFPPGQTQQQSDQEHQQEMVSSQEEATAAALSTLGIEVPTVMTIDQVATGSPAAAVLKSGDVIVGVAGKPVQTLSALRDAVQKVRPGQPVPITVRRAGAERALSVTTQATQDGHTVLGVYINPTFRFPFSVKIQIDNVGGPSAGMMFALGIIDTLTPGALTGGKQIAGTGTIDSDGTVGPIGGIQQKMIGARRAGATWFLAPADDCSEVVGHVPSGLHVVRVATLAEARSAVQAIGTGKGTSALPACTR